MTLHLIPNKIKLITCQNMLCQIVKLFDSVCHVGGAVGRKAFATQAGCWDFEYQPRQTWVVKTGSDNSIVKRLAIVWVSRVVGDDYYKQMPRVTCRVIVTRYRTPIARWPWVPSKGQHLQPFNGNGDFSIWVNGSRVGWNTSNMQTSKYILCKNTTSNKPQNRLCVKEGD